MKRGMTLTSLLLAVALSGIIAVFGGRLIVNQMFMAATAELIDKGDAVMQFYLNALRDREVWRCTIHDSSNTGFREYVFGTGVAVTGISLREPRCQTLNPTLNPAGQEWQTHPTLTGSNRSGELLPSGTAKYVGDSISGASVGSGDGWWKVELKVEPAGGRGDVDLVLNLCLQETVYTDKHKGQAQVPRGYRYKCPTNLTRRVRYSENAIDDDCAQKAIISVTDRRGAGVIDSTCSTSALLSFNANRTTINRIKHRLSPPGLGRPTNRQAIKPIPARNHHPLIGTTGTGEVIIGTNQVLLHSLGVGVGQGQTGGSLCGDELVDGRTLNLVVCGINNDGTIRCCSRKGPKGPDGLKGCPASKYYAVRGCSPGNNNQCPTIPNPLPPNGVPTCSSRQY